MPKMTFKFDAGHASRIARRALAADEWQPTWGQRERGEEPGPGLWLVKDQGVYLMSNAVGHHSQNDDDPPEGGWICYADGHDPNVDAFDDWWVGGDDFVELVVQGEELERLPEAGEMIVEVKADEILISWYEQRRAG